MKIVKLSRPYWKTQLPVDYIDTSLVINTWETVDDDLSNGSPAKLWYIIIEQTNNGATAEDIVLEITINGTAYSVSIAADSGTPYYVHASISLTTGDFTLLSNTAARACNDGAQEYKAIPFVAETVGLIRVKQTSNVDGTSAQIEVNVVWDKLVG